MHFHLADTIQPHSLLLSCLNPRILSKSYRTPPALKNAIMQQNAMGKKIEKTRSRGFVSCLHVLKETTCNARIERAIKSQPGLLSARFKAGWLIAKVLATDETFQNLQTPRWVHYKLSRCSPLFSFISRVLHNWLSPSTFSSSSSWVFFCHDLR